MTQKQLIESKIEELSQHLAENYYYTDFTSKKKFHNKLSTALKEIVEEHFKEIMVEKLDDHNEDSYEIGFNQALDQITSRHNKFLS